jgi:hypothetical protein
MLNEIVHRYLDNELSDKERTGLLKDDSFRGEINVLKGIFQNIRNLPTPEVDSLGFVSGVMTRIHQKQESIFHARHGRQIPLLKWNFVSAVAGLLMLITGIIVMKYWVVSEKGITGVKEPVSVSIEKKQPQVAHIKLSLNIPDAKDVFICGDFNDWKPDEVRLKEQDETGLWTITLSLQPGKVYQYMFVVDGNKWLVDPIVTTYVDDGFGGKNSLIDLRHDATF